ncbi:Metallo-dependent phosphatase-like protein [Bisporella sp. PMI_857]|nr:Metallo-dependent phosphatase-like protein [Bisporella sp. PMI_857]
MEHQHRAAIKKETAWRRQNEWDPPTLLDSLLTSPLRYLVSLLYFVLLAFRGAPFKPPRNKPHIRIVCISDTHSNTTSIPDGDVLIHAGDMVNSGSFRDIQAQIDWIASLPHREKIIIAGNHDNYFDHNSRKDEDNGHKLNLRSIHYLENKAITLRFKGGRKLNFYGSPGIPQIGGLEHAFQYQANVNFWSNRIPKETDVLITHTPPKHHLDLSMGCPSLLSEVWRVQPRLHVFGHVHSGHGKEAVYWDEGQLAYERVLSSTGTSIFSDLVPSATWWAAFKVAFYGVRGILWDRLMVGPGGSNGCLMVNAAIVWQSTTDVGNKPQIVDL